jgi:hypothetical protein
LVQETAIGYVAGVQESDFGMFEEAGYRLLMASGLRDGRVENPACMVIGSNDQLCVGPVSFEGPMRHENDIVPRLAELEAGSARNPVFDSLDEQHIVKFIAKDGAHPADDLSRQWANGVSESRWVWHGKSMSDRRFRFPAQ